MALPRTPALATDCVIFDPVGRVLLIRRKHAPCVGSYALPGGFVKIRETVEDACRREVREEASVELNELTLVGVYSDLNRTPRPHSQCCLWYPAPMRYLAERRVGCDERRMGR